MIFPLNLDHSTSLSTSTQIQTHRGLSLNQTLYYNLVNPNTIQGYVTSVTLRLFSNWKGNDPLYIYVMFPYSLNYIEILYRYPVIPERNNTDWHNISIPTGDFPLDSGYYVGVGMQDRSSTNLISAVLNGRAIYEVNITKITDRISLKQTKLSYGASFIYTVTPNVSLSSD